MKVDSCGGKHHLSHRKVLDTVLLAVLATLALNCFKDPLTPVAPSWDVNLTFPLGVKTVTVADLITKDSSVLRADRGNRLVYSTVMNAQAVTVGDQLSLLPAAASSGIRLGVFDVEIKPVVANINVPSIPPGQTMPVPSMTLNVPEVKTSLTSASSVTLASGQVTFTIRNNLPVEIIPLNPVHLRDSLGQTEAVLDLGTTAILPGGTRTVYDDLAGRTIGGSINIEDLNFSTPGSQSPVTIPADSMLVATVVLSDLHASAAQVGGIPAQRLSNNDRAAITFDDSTLIKQVSVRSGRLRFDFSNQIDADVRLVFRLEEVWRPMGGTHAQFEDSVFLPAHGADTYTLDLSGFELLAPPGALLDSLHLVSSMVIPAAITSPVDVKSTDQVQIAMNTLAKIIIDSASGILKPTRVAVNTGFALSTGTWGSKFKAQMNLPSASLLLNLASSLGFPADLDVRIWGTKATGETVYLDIPAGQRRVLPGSDVITFDGGVVGGFLSQFSGTLPDSLRISGTLLLNPPDCYSTNPAAVGTVGRNSSIGGSAQLSVPLSVGITHATYRDTTSFGTSDDGSSKKPDEEQLRRVNSAKVHVEVQNGVPAVVNFRVHLLDKLRQQVLTLPQTGQTFHVDAAATDAQGMSLSPGFSTIVVDLSHSEAQQYIPAEFLDYELEMMTPSGGTVTFRTTDAINVRVWTECSFGVNN